MIRVYTVRVIKLIPIVVDFLGGRGLSHTRKMGVYYSLYTRPM